MATATKALPVPPYTWAPVLLKKVPVYTPVGKFKTSHMDASGKVLLQDIKHQSKIKKFTGEALLLPAPKKMGFAECPACGTFHMKLTRRCTSCGESLVYYPQPAARSTALQTKNFMQRKVQKASKAVQAKKTSKTAEADPAAAGDTSPLTAVRSSTAYFLHSTYDFHTAADVVAAEHAVRHLEAHANEKRYEPLRTLKILTRLLESERYSFAAHGVDMSAYTLRAQAKKKSEAELFLTCILALLADSGQLRACKELAERKKLVAGETDWTDVKYLKDAWMNSLYNNQSAMVKMDRFRNLATA